MRHLRDSKLLLYARNTPYLSLLSVGYERPLWPMYYTKTQRRMVILLYSIVYRDISLSTRSNWQCEHITASNTNNILL